MAITKIPSIALSTEVAANLSGLKVTSISYASGSGAANSGGDTITLTGANFDANLEIYINSELVSNINVANSTSVSFTSPDVPIGLYVIYVVNPDGKTAIVAPGLNAIEGYTFQGTVSGYSSGGAGNPSGVLFNVIEKFSFSSDGNTTDVGDLTQGRYQPAGQSSSVSGYTSGGGPTPSNVIDKFPFASDGNATDVGDLTQARYEITGQSSAASGYTSGGFSPAVTPTILNTIDKFPFATDANATDVGDLTQGRYAVGGQSSTDNGYTSGGNNPVNTIDKFPFASDANATDVGDLSVSRRRPAGQSSSVSGYSSGGGPIASNVIDKFPFASNANATDVGDLSQARGRAASQSSTVNGYTTGGLDSGILNTIDKFPFSSDANATDVGDLINSVRGPTGQQV
jgi:hypothetical protein